MLAGSRRAGPGLVQVCVLAMVLVAGNARGQTSAAADTAAAGEPTPRLPAIGAADTVRTNLWLARAVLADVAEVVVRALPPPPGAVVLRPRLPSVANTLFTGAAEDLLQAQGYKIFLDERDIADKNKPYTPPQVRAGAAEIRFSCEDVTLTYPRAGRRFGLWRQWVDRELSVAVAATVLDRDSGQLLYDGRVTRAYGDRVPADRFESVRSVAYPFTDARVPESGWRHRAEEAVVIGTLIGLVALYFANTGS